MAEALYRKYRPKIFEDVVGQEPIERTIKNALAQDKVSHAYLFCGPRGTGKTTTARLLAKALLCEKGPTPDPDGTCEDCEMIADGIHPDVYELDAASRTGVENVREEIISRVQFAPTRGSRKVYIIDEVHMLSTAAFNALLKTLEEPPSHVVFILCTTDAQKVPETIHSRCQRFDFRRISPEAIVSYLGAICVAEDVSFEGEALDLIAHRAEGGMRNALTSLEQIIAFDNGKVTLAGAERLLGSIDSNDMAEIITALGKRDVAAAFRWTAQYMETGADLAQFTRDMAEHVRNLYIMALVGDDVELEVSETDRQVLVQELQWFGPDRLARMLAVIGDLSAELKTSSNPRLSFEIALTRLVRPESDLTLEALAERIEALVGRTEALAERIEALEKGASANVSVEAEKTNEDSSCEDSAPTNEKVFLNPAALQRMWQVTLAGLKKVKSAYGVLFLNTRATYDTDNDCLAIQFPKENTFAFKAVQKPEIKDALAAELAKAAGSPVRFSYVQENSSVEQSIFSHEITPEHTRASSDAILQRGSALSKETVLSKDEVMSKDISPSASVVVPEDTSLSQDMVASADTVTPTDAVTPADTVTPTDAVTHVDMVTPAHTTTTIAADTVIPTHVATFADTTHTDVPADSATSADQSSSFAPPSSNEQASLEDVAALLRDGFGEGVIIKEIKEE